MAKFELTIYGENDEVLKKYETDRVRWSATLKALKVYDELKRNEATPYEQFESINNVMKSLFVGITEEHLDLADTNDVLNTLKQAQSLVGVIESSKNA